MVPGLTPTSQRSMGSSRLDTSTTSQSDTLDSDRDDDDVMPSDRSPRVSWLMQYSMLHFATKSFFASFYQTETSIRHRSGYVTPW